MRMANHVCAWLDYTGDRFGFMTTRLDAAGRLLLLPRWPQADAAAAAPPTFATAPQSSPLSPAPANGHDAQKKTVWTSLFCTYASNSMSSRGSAMAQLTAHEYNLSTHCPFFSSPFLPPPTHQQHCLGLSLRGEGRGAHCEHAVAISKHDICEVSVPDHHQLLRLAAAEGSRAWARLIWQCQVRRRLLRQQLPRAAALCGCRQTGWQGRHGLVWTAG